MPTPAWISLGSNLGDRRAILDESLVRLAEVPGVAIAAVSSYRETLPVGGPAGQGPFLNAAARLETTRSPRELLAATQRVERDLGRVRSVRWGERTLDIDILMYDSQFVEELDLALPHPRLTVRRFVLEPLVEIDPQLVDAITKRTMAALLANLDRRPRLLMLDDSIGSRLATKLPTLAAAISGVLVDASPIFKESTAATRSDRRLAHQDRLERLDSIRSAIRRSDESASGWVVASFFLNIESLRTSTEPHGVELSLPDDGWQAEQALWKSQVEGCIVDVPDPTLMIAATDSRWKRKAGVSSTPIYWPEATEPNAILAEVAAVCRGIEG